MGHIFQDCRVNILNIFRYSNICLRISEYNVFPLNCPCSNLEASHEWNYQDSYVPLADTAHLTMPDALHFFLIHCISLKLIIIARNTGPFCKHRHYCIGMHFHCDAESVNTIPLHISNKSMMQPIWNVCP